VIASRSLVAVAACVLVAGACRPKLDATPGANLDDAIVRSSESGPVKATVSLTPAKPTLGDTLHLRLKVRAAKGVEVRMPAFGEALGRFSITGFTPRNATLPDGSTEASQEYQLEAPMSGKQKIPALLVEFLDRRAESPKATTAAAVDGGAPPAESSELLTEELALDVASVMEGEEKAGALRGPLGPLDESEGAGRRRRWPLYAGGAALVAAALVASAIVIRRRRRTAIVRDALEEALARLAALESAGLPAPEAADGWYVEISAIVRRYLEDRFALRAPELTTEEFLARAGDSSWLALAHRALLRSFLEQCDRVKFAAYRPPESESREVIAAARRFLEETRPTADEAAAANATPGSADAV
jgi:hypothetical protein